MQMFQLIIAMYQKKENISIRKKKIFQLEK